MPKANVATESVIENIQGAKADMQVAHTIVIFTENLTEQSKVDALYNYLGTAKVQIAHAMNEVRPHTSYHQEANSDSEK